MNYERILEKKIKYEQNKSKIDAITLSSYEKDFELRFTHHSTAMEGNTLTLMETKVVLEDGVSVDGKELREIYEVINHKKAYDYVKRCIAANKPLTENIIKDLHAILTENIIVGGIYRNQEVRISGAGFIPPAGNGRTSRLLMNYQLMSQGFLPVSVDKETRLDYYNALEQYAVSDDLNPFADFVADLEEERLDVYLKMILM